MTGAVSDAHLITAGVIGLLGGAVLVALVVLLLRARASAPANRALALYFALLAINMVGLYFAPFVDRRWQYNAALLWLGATLAGPFAYARFFPVALATPLAAPLRHRAVRAGLLVIVGVALALPWIAPSFVLRPNSHEEFTLNRLEWASATWLDLTAAFGLILVSAYGLVCSISAYRRAPRGSAARDQARRYALAFGLFDGWAAVTVILLFVLALTSPVEVGGTIFVFVSDFITPLVVIASLALLAHAMLRYQLFDVDVRLKRTVARSALAATFVLVFFVVEQVVQQFLSAEFGLILGGVAAAALVFALRPLEALAARVADLAMPRVQDTPAHVAERKAQIYRAAVESALTDGIVTDKERDVLATLAEQLGLDATEAQAIERDASALSGGA